MVNILLIEDDLDLCEILKSYLTLAGYNLTIANTGIDGIKETKKQLFDLILLDIFLPDNDGFSVCQSLRQTLICPIIFISSTDNSDYIVKALRLGGDDFLIKPFDFDELIARIDANIRRVEMLQNKPFLDNGNFIKFKTFLLNTETKKIEKEDKVITLSPLEFDILNYMIDHPYITLSYEDIYSNVWREDSLGDIRTVMVHVSNLRKKIQHPTHPYIQTIRKKGYIFSPE